MENIIEWKNMRLVLHEFKKSHANGGRLGKFWIEDINSGRTFLIKGSSFLNYEPFSEKIAYIIGKNIGMDVLEYDILPAKLFKEIIPLNPFCRYISICEKIDRKNYSIMSVAEIKRARNIVRDANEPKITNREVMYELLPQQYIDNMILFDAIIGNADRHYGNIHLLRDTNGNIIGAPIIDNGASCLAQSHIIITYLLGFKVGEMLDRACTVEDTHNKQVEYIRSLKNVSFNIPAKTISIMNEIQSVLDLMPKLRVKPTKKYIAYRLHKYLGLIKRTELYKEQNAKSVSFGDIIKEKEHT